MTRRLVYELSNERTVILSQQCNTHTEGHVTGTDLTSFSATVMSLVQMFLGFKEDALYSLPTTTTSISHAIILLFRIANVGTFRITTAKARLHRRHGCYWQVETTLFFC